MFLEKINEHCCTGYSILAVYEKNGQEEAFDTTVSLPEGTCASYPTVDVENQAFFTSGGSPGIQLTLTNPSTSLKEVRIAELSDKGKSFLSERE